MSAKTTKILPASLTDALNCREGDEIQRLCKRLEEAMQRLHGCEFRILIDHQVGLAMVCPR